MRTRAGTGAWIMAVLLGAVALVVPLAAGATAGTTAASQTTSSPPPSSSAPPSPQPSPSSTLAYPCKTAPTMPSSPPNTPPSAPGTPEVVSVFMTTARLTWAPATDEDGIACYYVREVRNGVVVNVASFQPAVTQGDVHLPWPPYGVSSEVHELYVVAVDTKGAVGPASGTVAVTVYNDVIVSPSASPQPSCRVNSTSWPWSDGMTTSISITNTGASPVRGWRLTFLFQNSGQRVTSGWSATWSQTGSLVTAAAPAWSPDIAPGDTVTIGFNGSHTGANPAPAQWKLNGSVCAAG